MYACMTPVGFDTSDKFGNHCCSSFRLIKKFVRNPNDCRAALVYPTIVAEVVYQNYSTFAGQ